MRYANGGLVYAAQDLRSNAFGQRWGHTRSYTNKVTGTQSVAQNRNGANWFVQETPQLIPTYNNGNLVAIAVVGLVQNTRWFNVNGTAITARYFFPERLSVTDSGTSVEQYLLLDASGRRLTFYGFHSDIDDALRGQFKALTAASGRSYAANYDSAGRLSSFAQSNYSSSSSSYSSAAFSYEYYTSGENSGRLHRVSLAANGVNTERAEYNFFSSADLSGGVAGDLKSVSHRAWNGSDWAERGRTYYRYYKAGETGGFAHGLKFVVGPEAYRRVQSNLGIAAEEASDSQLQGFADYRFEYDQQQRVISEQVQGGAETYDYEYVEATTHTEYNAWANKTIETLPGGNHWIVYTNSQGLVILKILRSSTGVNLEYLYQQYDETTGPTYGAEILRAQSSAIDPASFDQNGDPNEQLPGLGIQLRSSSGVVWIYEWHEASSDSPGQMKSTSIQQGANTASRAKLSEWTYTAVTAGGQTVYLPATYTTYQQASAVGSEPATVSLDYSIGSELQPSTLVITLPTITTVQNGSGAANSKTVLFSADGLAAWEKDERGVINYTGFDDATGGVLKSIDDVNSALFAAPWTTPAGYGRHFVTDYTVDSRGRVTQEIGPAHLAEGNGTAISVRRVRGWSYRDWDFETQTAEGYLSGSQLTWLDPITVTRLDSAGRLTDSIQVWSEAGFALPDGIELSQSSYKRWQRKNYDDQGRVQAERTYFNIPQSGEGTLGVNYFETSYGYGTSQRLRPMKVTGPDGTITWTVYDLRGRAAEIWIGTNDALAEDANHPSGGAAGPAAGNNMTPVSLTEFDHGQNGGDSLVTKFTQLVDVTTANNRVTDYAYDARNRRWKIAGGEGYFCRYSYDNRDRVTGVEFFNGNDASGQNLVSKRSMHYDLLGRLYKGIRYGVTLGTGAATTEARSVRDEFWYDEVGNLIKILRRGRRSFEKFRYDGLNRITRQYYCYDLAEYGSPNYAAANSVTADTVMHQFEWTYGAGGNLTQQVMRERFHNAVGTGELKSVTVEPKARVSNSAFYYDPVGRTVAVGDYGANAAAFTRPAAVPPSTSLSLVTRAIYGESGKIAAVIDPRGTREEWTYDVAGRLASHAENVLVQAFPTPDANRLTSYSYDGAGRLAGMTVANAVTGAQVTEFVHGVQKNGTDSDVARNDLVQAMIYPDREGNNVTDRVRFRYNRLGEVKEKRDQLATVHTYIYDKLGRWTEDRVTSVPSGNVSSSVRRISRTFEPRGRIAKMTSWSAPTSGTVVNDIERLYNEYRQLISEAQSSSGAVTTGSPKVEYGYAVSGTNLQNTIRRTQLKYPDGRALTYGYGAVDGMNDMLGRVEQLLEGTTVRASYTYMGWEHRARVLLSQPNLELSHIQTSSSEVSDAGDPYTGWDRFGRVEQMRWIVNGGSSTTEWLQSGFDQEGNRTWRDNVLAPHSAAQDEAYEYDGASQLTRLQRGVLNTNRTGIAGVPVRQEEWQFDATGNWRNYLTGNSGSVAVNQTRTHNKANEITSLPGWGAPFSDAVGNTTGAPSAQSSSSMSCQYDPWNRLVAVNTVDLSSSSISCSFSYDAADRRLTRNFSGAGSSSTTVQTSERFVHSDQWQLLEKTGVTGRFSSSSSSFTSTRRQFVWGMRYPDDLLWRDRGDNSTSTPPTVLDQRQYVVHDYYHVSALVSPTGTTLQRFGYDAYGTPRVMNANWQTANDSYDWEFRFGAAYHEPLLALYLMRYRWLHTLLGRWMTRDPAGYQSDFAQGPNLYSYVLNRAASFVDPTGLAFTDPSGPEDWPECPEDPCRDEYRKCHKRASRVYNSQEQKCVGLWNVNEDTDRYFDCLNSAEEERLRKERACQADYDACLRQ